jgi:hypothetical protein
MRPVTERLRAARSGPSNPEPASLGGRSGTRCADVYRVREITAGGARLNSTRAPVAITQAICRRYGYPAMAMYNRRRVAREPDAIAQASPLLAEQYTPYGSARLLQFEASPEKSSPARPLERTPSSRGSNATTDRINPCSLFVTRCIAFITSCNPRETRCVGVVTRCSRRDKSERRPHQTPQSFRSRAMMRALPVPSSAYARVIVVDRRADARNSAAHLFTDTRDAIGCTESSRRFTRLWRRCSE